MGKLLVGLACLVLVGGCAGDGLLPTPTDLSVAPDLWTPCAGLWSCGDRCVNLNSDRNHCGTCGNACGDAPCVNGRCFVSGEPRRLAKFTAERYACAGQGPAELALGDLDGDGRLDVVTANEGSGDLCVFLNAGGGRLASSELAPGVTMPTGLVLAELDGRVSPGLDAAVLSRSGRVLILRNQAGRLINAQTAFQALHPGTDAIVAMATRGGVPTDLILGSASADRIEVHFGDGGARFDGLLPVEIATDGPVLSLATADLDGDARPDLVAGTPGRLLALVNRGNPLFERAGTFDMPGGLLHNGVRVLDFDGDKRLDLISCAARQVAWVFGRGNDGNGAPRFSTPTLQGPPGMPLTHSAFAMGAFRFDELPDLVIASESERTVRVFASYSSVLVDFAQPDRYDVPGPRAVALGDMNGDGALDIVTANPGDNSVTVLLDTIK